MGKHLITTLLVLFIGVQAFAQSSVSGKVTDKAGEPLVGAGVLVKGTTNGTVTDLDGKFSLSGLNASSVLVFSSIGYEAQEITVGGQKVINVTLNDETEFLDDVVVVAYGTAKKRDLTGSMSSIKGENIKAQNVSSISAPLKVRLLVSSCLRLTVSRVSTWRSVSVELPPPPTALPSRSS